MSEGNRPDEINDKPVFEALLTPHRSLGRRGFVILMLVFAVLCLFNGILFLAAGAWPVFAFCGFSVLLLLGAFWLNYRAGRAREKISMSRTRLQVVKITPSGRITEYLFNPLWARLRVARHDEAGITDMQVTGEGRSTDIGSFLNPDDRETFASAFSGALARLRKR